MLFYTEQLEQISSSRQQAAHALYVGDTDRWPDAAEWEIEETFDALAGLVDEQRNPTCPDCDGEGYHSPDGDGDTDGVPCRSCATNAVIDRDLGRHADEPELDEHGKPWPDL